MEDSYEYDTIKETNEEHSPDRDEHEYGRKHPSKLAPRYSNNVHKHKAHMEADVVLKDRTNKSHEIKVGHFKNQKEAINKGIRQNAKANKYGEEEDLSSLSGFTQSDNEENQIRVNRSPNEKDCFDDPSDDEDVAPKQRKTKEEELQEKFAHYERLRMNAEQDRREREVRYEKENPGTKSSQTIKRPFTAGGVVRSSLNMKPSETRFQSRPMTSNPYGEDLDDEGEMMSGDRPPISFKPVYTKPILQTLMEKKVFDYKDKKFKTIPKKFDPVSRINAFKNEWKKTKFLKSNSSSMKEGRKLLLCERNTLYASTSNLSRKF